MKKIIVPIDFSKHSEYALETAAILAKKYDAKIIALHMLQTSEALLNLSGTEQQSQTLFYLKLAEQKFSNFIEKDYLKGVTVTPLVKHYRVFSEINEIAEEHNGDLVIMGSHGATGFKEAFIGSNTEKVIRTSNIPVLVIKENPILTDFESVVFACDFSEEAVSSYINAKKLFNALNTKMKLIYVNTPNISFKSTPEMEEKVADFLKKADGNLDAMNDVAYVCDYNVEQGILNFANSFGADLIAMATHGRKGFAHLFEGSISEDVANHSSLPVITFKMQ